MPLSKKVLTRLIGAPLLLAALGGLLYWGHTFVRDGKPNWPLCFLLTAVGLLAAYELHSMARAKGIGTNYAILALALLFLALAWISSDSLRILSTSITILVVLFLVLACMIVFAFGKFTPEAAGLTLFVFIYIAMLGFLLFPPVPPAVSTVYLLFLLAAGKGSDMAAYCVGKTMGKHKMAPVVSPNKTWEGGIGGAIVGTVAGFLVIALTPLKAAYASVPWPALLFLALLVTIAAQVGDLVKSAFKRWAGVKDSGRLLPEFGGMLDMVDSFLVCAPVAHLATIVLLRVFT